MPDDSERRKNCAIGLKTLARENSRGAVRRNRAGRKSVSLAIVRVLYEGSTSEGSRVSPGGALSGRYCQTVGSPW
jgi:hypothetical protein